MADSPRDSSPRGRLTIAGAMGLTLLAALALAALRSPSVGMFGAASATTGVALLAAFVVAREVPGAISSFAFGFAVFGSGYYLALTPWEWGLSKATTFALRINTGLPTADWVSLATSRLAGPPPGLPIPPAPYDSAAYDAWATRYQLLDGLLHLGVTWLFAAIGGGFALWLRRDRRPGPRGRE